MGGAVDCERGEIFTVNPDGSGLVRLTHDTRTEKLLRWSPDRGQATFYRVPRPRQLGQVRLMDANGAHQRRLTHLRTIFFGDLRARLVSGRRHRVPILVDDANGASESAVDNIRRLW